MADLIHQLYCTHCTYGTSALHRRTDGAVKEQVFEYSTRSGSVAREKSHDFFRQLEPYMYLHLPGDMPPSDMMRYTGQTSPWRRLVFLPSVGGLQVLAHVCYRQTDTRGRPGSYFAHVLLQERKQGRDAWSAVECLKHWGSRRWEIADSTTHRFELDPVKSLDDFRGTETMSAIDDPILYSFLTSEPGDTFVDPGQVIPERWRRKPAEERRQLMIDALQAVLDLKIDPPHRQSLLLAVEPSMAALIFYGVARLLPRKGLAEKLSFSTFESHHDRPKTVLAATTFHDPNATDLSPEEYRSRGTVINTFNGKRSPKERREPGFSEFMVETLVNRGWKEIQDLRFDAETANAAGRDELDSIAQINDLASHCLLDDAVMPITKRPQSPQGMTLLRRALVRALSADSHAALKRVVGSSRHAMFLEILGVDDPAIDADHEIEMLLARLPLNQVPIVVQSHAIAIRHRVALIAHVVRRQGALPVELECLWDDPGNARESGILAQVLKTLDQAVISKWGNGIKVPQRATYLRCLAQVSAADASKRPMLNALIRAFDDDALFGALRGSDKESRVLLDQFVDGDATIAEKAERFLVAIPRFPERFNESVICVNRCQRFLPPSRRQIAAAWDDFRAAILRASGLAKDNTDHGRDQNAVPKLGRRMQSLLTRALNGYSAKAGERGLLNYTWFRSVTLSVLKTDGNHQAHWKKLVRTVFPAVIEGMEDDQLFQFLSSESGRAWLKDCPIDEPALRGRLCSMLYELADDPSRFSSRLAILSSLHCYIPDEQARVEAWKSFHSILKGLRTLWDRSSGRVHQNLDVFVKSGFIAAYDNATRGTSWIEERDWKANFEIATRLVESIVGEAMLKECQSLTDLFGAHFLKSRGTASRK